MNKKEFVSPSIIIIDIDNTDIIVTSGEIQYWQKSEGGSYSED